MNRTNLVEDLTLLASPPWWLNPWFITTVLLSVALVTGLVVWLARKLRQPRVSPPPPAEPPPSPEAFLRRLAELRARQPALAAYPLAIEVSDLLRSWLEARHRFRIRYQTSREFLREASTRPELAEPQRAALDQFLNACDGIKFGRSPASPHELAGLLDTAERVIRETAPHPSTAATAPSP
jgi:hypothetical protein